jgi:hypothetical protein
VSAEKAAASPCRGCGGLIFFVKTPNGKNMPVNLEPDSTGNVAVYRDVSGTFQGRTLTKSDNAPSRGETLYMPHMATCVALRKREPAASNVIPLTGNREVPIR